jgi:hypothetical protein
MHARRHTVLTLATAAAALVALLVAPAIAHAANGVTVTSPVTNPSMGDVDAWRQGWGRDLFPQFIITNSPDPAVAGIYYTIDRSSSTVIPSQSAATWQQALQTEAAPWTIDRLDVAGAYNYPPATGWPAPQIGTHDPLEGRWYWHFVLYRWTGTAVSAVPQFDMPFNIDLTPPDPVTTVLVTPDRPAGSVGVAPSTTAVGSSRRVTVSWKGTNYDDLAGTAYFTLYDGGTALYTGPAGIHNEGGSDATHTAQGNPPFWYAAGWTHGYAQTLEVSEAGKHVFTLTNTDKALNESAKSAPAVYYSDPDVPAVAFSGKVLSTIGALPAISVDASDSCLRDVTIKVDGLTVAHSDATTMSMTLTAKPNLSALSNGTHRIYATATDMFGRIVTINRSVVLDKTPPVLSSISLPLYNDAFMRSTFFPIKRDKFWDTAKMSYRVSEYSTVLFEVHKGSASGAVVYTAQRTGSGSSSFTWNGLTTGSKTPVSGTYVFVLRATDVARNVSKTVRATVYIRDFQIQKLANNRYRIVSR